MLTEIAPYLLLLLVAVTGGILLTSKTMAEKLVSAGVLPRSFLGFLPMIQTFLRVLGGVLIVIGIIQIGIEGGWLSRVLLQRYAFPGAAILLGVALLLLSRRTN